MPATKPRAKPTITHVLHDLEAARVLEIRSETARTEKRDYYVVEPIRSDFGKAFVLRKCGPEPAVYHCCVVDAAVGEDGAETLCDCRGWEAYGYCRHVTSLAALVAEGKL
jgi:hypothetical protein